MKKVNPKSTAKPTNELATKAVSDLVAPPLSKQELLTALVRVKRIEINTAMSKASAAASAAASALDAAWDKFGRSEVLKINLSDAPIRHCFSHEWNNGAPVRKHYFSLSSSEHYPDALPKFLKDAIAASEKAISHKAECIVQVGRSDADLRREISAQIDAQSGKASRVDAVLKDAKAITALKDVLQKLADAPARASSEPLTIQT